VRGRLFTKLAREIQIAARAGSDPLANFALRLAVERARAENMPKENIDRAIRRGAGLEKDAHEIEEASYEGYGPHGVAILVNCLTDNRNRTIADVRRCFTRGNGSLGEPGSVAWQFTETGYIIFHLFDDEDEPRAINIDDVFMVALENGAEDVVVSDDAVEIYTARNDLAHVTQQLSAAGFEPNESKLIMNPNTTLALSPDEAANAMNLIEALEELDDVNNVYHNLELTDELVAQFA
jgi:YebC/PmpR family DNA-binding regulatory protein